jgi:hypothetical protein
MAPLVTLLVAVAAFAAVVAMSAAPSRTGGVPSQALTSKARTGAANGATFGIQPGQMTATAGAPEQLPASLLAAVERARYAILPEQRAGVAFEGLKGELADSIPRAAYVASNPAQRLAVRFTESGVSLKPEDPKTAWHSELRVTGLGYGARLQQPPEATLSALDNRVELRRGSVTEWYQNDARGLEQGFTLNSRPQREAGGPLVVRMSVAGDLRPVGDGSGHQISLVDRSKKPVLTYSQLHAYDAVGRKLPARMTAREGALSLQVEDEGAAYPITIDPFVFQAKLVPPPSQAGESDHFGGSVAISGDTALVGAPNHRNTNGTTGSAYAFVRSGASWTLQQMLPSPTLGNSGYFGTSVAIDGDTALIGAPGSSLTGSSSTGSAYVFVRSGSSWSMQQQLLASDRAAADTFGSSVSLDVDTALVGSPLDDNPKGTDAGAAYAFVRSGTSWSQQRKFTALDGANGDSFGQAVALSLDTALIGASLDDTTAGGSNAGSAHVYTRTGTSWTFQQKLTAPDAAAGDQFGNAVALSGETALIGAWGDDNAHGAGAGSAYVFLRSGTTWSLQQQLTASDGATDDVFGSAVALEGDTAVVGAQYDDTLRGASGSAYVFTRSGTAWSLQRKLTAPDGRGGDAFGSSVALGGDTVLAGAPYDDTAGVRDGGSAYVFVRSDTSWSSQQKLELAEGALTDDAFGKSVALSGDTALVGSPDDDTATNGVTFRAGSAYVFVRSGTTWSLQQKLTALDGGTRDGFGGSVALSGDTALIGSPADDTSAGADAGSAYVFVRIGTSWGLRAGFFGAAGDAFGSSVALEGDTAVVGAPADDTAAGANAGSAYVFTRNITDWNPQQRLTAPGSAAGDAFGSSVASSADTALVGAPLDDIPQGGGLDPLPDVGSAYAFVRSGTSWSFQRRFSRGVDFDRFGTSVGLNGETALVGAPYDDNANGTDAGSAYVFVRSVTSWSLQQMLMASGGVFGRSVALETDTALIGSQDSTLHTGAGAAHVFSRSGTSWTFQKKLTPVGATNYDNFGSAVALDGATALGGAPDNGRFNSGTGYAQVFVGP